MDLVDFLVIVIPVNLTLLSLFLNWQLLSLCNLFLNTALFFLPIVFCLISAAGLMYFFSSLTSALWSKSTFFNLIYHHFSWDPFQMFLPHIFHDSPNQHFSLHLGCGLVLNLTYEVLKILVLKFSEFHLFIFQKQITLLVVVQNFQPTWVNIWTENAGLHSYTVKCNQLKILINMI